MGENIALLYMSAYFAQPAPEGSKNRFLRTQTNEAAVSALWKDPASRPDKIVALCSDTVRTKPTVPAADGSGNKVPTLEYFRDEFLKQLGVQPEQLVAVSVPDSMEEADQTRAISAVLEQVAENDNLYIDLSGGMRDTATLLLIVARYLKDIRMVQTKKVLYSELKGNSSVVRDSTGLYNLMELWRRESYTTRACSSTATRSTTPRTARLNFKRTQGFCRSAQAPLSRRWGTLRSTSSS